VHKIAPGPCVPNIHILPFGHHVTSVFQTVLLNKRFVDSRILDFRKDAASTQVYLAYSNLEPDLGETVERKNIKFIKLDEIKGGEFHHGFRRYA
jgi:hypothetical protein